MIRTFNIESDIQLLRELHEKYFKDEFPFPDFFNNCMASLVYEDSESGVIALGAVKTYSELVVIPDRSKSPHERKAAYLQLLKEAMTISKIYGYDQLHAFVNGDRWIAGLKRFGFTNCKGTPLYIGLDNG